MITYCDEKKRVSTFYLFIEILDIKSKEQNMNLFLLSFELHIYGLQLLHILLSSIFFSTDLQKFSL